MGVGMGRVVTGRLDDRLKSRKYRAFSNVVPIAECTKRDRGKPADRPYPGEPLQVTNL